MNKVSNTAGTGGQTKVKDCACEHEYQDAKYGRGKRVHNPCKSKSGGKGLRCTVCNRQHDE